MNIVNCVDDASVDEAPVPATSLDACTSCCSRSSSMSCRLVPVAFVTGVGILFDSSFSLHSSVMSSTCLLFDFHSDSRGLHLLLLLQWFPSIISPPNTCRPHALDYNRRCSTTTRERRSVPRRTVTYPWLSETKIIGTSTTDSSTRMFLTSFPQHWFGLPFSVPCLHASPANT